MVLILHDSSFNEGFGSLSTQATPPPLSIRCPKCEAVGHIVFIHQGTVCQHCHVNKRLTPPPDLPNNQLLEPTLHAPTHRYFNHLPQIGPAIEIPRRLSLAPPRQFNSEFDPMSRRSSISLPVPPRNKSNNSPINDSPRTMTTLLTPFHPYPPPHPPIANQYHINKHSDWKPSIQRPEKDIRHCDTEKVRRDHQSAYIDLGFSLRKKFIWPEDVDAVHSQPTPPISATYSFSNLGDYTSPSSSFISYSNSCTNLMLAASITSDRSTSDAKGISSIPATGTGSRREKLTKQTKLHQQVLWEFRACLRIDKERVREWLDDVREQGEELRRKKREVMECGWEMWGRKSKFGNEVRCSKDEAVLEVWSVMEREFWEFCSAERDGR